MLESLQVNAQETVWLEKIICFFSLLREYISFTFFVNHFCKHYLLPFIVRYDFMLRLNVCKLCEGPHI